MKTITVEATGSPLAVTRDQTTINIHFARRRLAALNKERDGLVKQIRKYQGDLKLPSGGAVGAVLPGD